MQNYKNIPMTTSELFDFVQKENSAMKSALHCMGFNPEKVIEFMSVEGNQFWERKMFSSLIIEIDIEKAKSTGCSDNEISAMENIFNSTRRESKNG